MLLNRLLRSNFDNSVQRLKAWVSEKPGTPGGVMSPNSSTAQLAGLGLAMSAVSAPGGMSGSGSSDIPPLTSSQKKRIKQYLKRCRMNPRHSQLNLEGYLLLPVQRIPRYRLLVSCLSRVYTVISLIALSSSWKSLSGYVRHYMIIWKILSTRLWRRYLPWQRT